MVYGVFFNINLRPFYRFWLSLYMSITITHKVSYSVFDNLAICASILTADLGVGDVGYINWILDIFFKAAYISIFAINIYSSFNVRFNIIILTDKKSFFKNS